MDSINISNNQQKLNLSTGLNQLNTNNSTNLAIKIGEAAEENFEESLSVFTRADLKQIIPHREPMLLIDEAAVKVFHTQNQGDVKKAVGKYRVNGDEWFLQGHFPNNPVVPGVILCEMMAQACCVLLTEEKELTLGKAVTPYFTGLDKVKFRRKVMAGDTLEIECQISRIKKPFCFATGKGFVDGKLAVSGEFSFAITPTVL